MEAMTACDSLYTRLPPPFLHLTRKVPIPVTQRTLEDRLSRLADVSNMQQGWYDNDEGEQPNSASVDKARAFLEQHPTFDSPIYPMVTGGVELEWDRLDTNWCPSLCFSNEGNVDYCSFSVRDATNDVVSDLTDLSTEQLVEFIKSEQNAGRA